MEATDGLLILFKRKAMMCLKRRLMCAAYLLMLQGGCGNKSTGFQKKDTVITTPNIKVESGSILPVKKINDYPEHWFWKNKEDYFELHLVHNGDSIAGKYLAMYNNGLKIDGADDTLSNYVSGARVNDTFIVTFNSAFSYQSGKDSALLIYHLKNKTLVWLRQSHHFEAYVPDKAILSHRKGDR